MRRSRAFARGAAKTHRPRLPAGVWALTRGAQLISTAARVAVTRAVAKLNTKGVRMYDSMPVPDYSGAEVLDAGRR